MTVSVVIPAWCWDERTFKMACACLYNLWETEGNWAANLEVILVYSGIDDGGRLDAFADKVIRIEPAQGWAAQSNIGLMAATGDYLCVGSIDVRVPPIWLRELVQAAGEDTIASPYDFKEDGVTRRTWDKTMRGSFWGAWFLFPRVILDTIGYFDGYTMRRYADMDWAIRARKAGFKTVRVPVRARHIAPHHALKKHPDPHDEIVVAAFRKRHEGTDRFGSWEKL